MTRQQLSAKVQQMQEELVALVAERMRQRAAELIEAIDWRAVAREEIGGNRNWTLADDELDDFDAAIASALEQRAGE